MAAEPLYGDPAANAPVWSDYAVVLGGLTATTPTAPAAFALNDGTTVTDEWDPIGALASDTPFDDGEESVDSSDHTAAGHGVYAVTHKNQKETVTFTAKETTLVTLGLLYDVSAVTKTGSTLSGVLKRRDPSKKFKVGFQRSNGTDMERRVSRNYAQIDSISRSFGDDESTREVTLLIVPKAVSGGQDEMYDYYLGPKA